MLPPRPRRRIFPDAARIPEGCYISTAAYLAKFRTACPGEVATPLTVHLDDLNGPHTVALVSWRGHWWVRDGLLGVLPVGAALTPGGITEALRTKATTVLELRTLRLSKHKRERFAAAGERLAALRDAAGDIATAATLLPYASERIWVSCGNRDVPMLSFRPSPGVVAVYHPNHGTATAETTITSSARVVELVARELGYRVVAVRREPALATAPVAENLALATAR